MSARAATSSSVTAGSIALYGGFLLTGTVAVLLGPLIPELEARWGVTHAEVASLFLAQFAASSVGAVLSSYRPRRSLIVGYALVAAGLLGLAGLPWPLTRLAMALVGLGLGLAIPATNLWVAHRNPRRRGAALAWLNMSWGVGAFLSPLLFAALLGRVPTAGLLAALAALAALVSITLAVSGPRQAAAAPEPRSPAAAAGGDRPALVLLAAILFLYVGSENAVGGWLVAFSDELGGGRSAVSLWIGSGFWAALLAGRAAAPALLRRWSEPALYRASLAVAGAGMLLLALAGSRPAVAAGALLAGVGLAPLFPLTVSILAERTEADGSRRTGWLFAFGGLGGAALPWLSGQVADAAPGHAFAVPLAGLVLLAMLYLLLRSRADCLPIRG